MRIASDASVLGGRTTQTVGFAEFRNVPCGTWTITIAKDGFETVVRTAQVTGPAISEIRAILTPKMQTSSVEVTDTAAPPVEQSASQSHELRPVEVKTLPTNPATVEDALPLEPGIVRTQNGELKIDGTGQERSAMIVNQTDITDPATGKFGQTVPIDSIESVNVLNTALPGPIRPLHPERNRRRDQARRGKMACRIKRPLPRFPHPQLPHARHSQRDPALRRWVAPWSRNRVYLITALQYILRKDPSRTLPFPYNESKQESINSFTQLDVILSPKQLLAATFHFSPQHTNFVNPDYFNPQPVTPSYAQQNYVGTLIDHFGIFNGILDSGVSFQRFNAHRGRAGRAPICR